MKIPKKELESIARTYKYWKAQEGTQELFEGMKMALVTMGVLKQVENAIFKEDHKKALNQIETMEALIDKAYGKKFRFDCKKIDTYKDDIQFMQRLSYEEKTVLTACINYIETY